MPDDIRARVLIGVAGVEDDNDAYDAAIAHARQGMHAAAGIDARVGRAHARKRTTSSRTA